MPAPERQPSSHRWRGVLVAAGIVLFLILGCVYFFSQTPALAHKALAGIDVHFGEYRASITDRAVCESILKELCQARRALAVPQWAGHITFRYVDGSTRECFLTIDKNTFWMGGSRIFAGDAGRLRILLANGGADVSKVSGP
jgi:hypothetical protein